MKLELKHLVPYLPYKIWFIYEGKKLLSKGIYSIKGTWYLKATGGVYDIDKCKPILRPLSNLTKRDAREHNYPDEGHLERSLLSGHAPYEVWNEYVKEHFDVFGLIEKGLAIDINTLNN